MGATENENVVHENRKNIFAKVRRMDLIKIPPVEFKNMKKSVVYGQIDADIHNVTVKVISMEI